MSSSRLIQFTVIGIQVGYNCTRIILINVINVHIYRSMFNKYIKYLLTHLVIRLSHEPFVSCLNSLNN